MGNRERSREHDTWDMVEIHWRHEALGLYVIEHNFSRAFLSWSRSFRAWSDRDRTCIFKPVCGVRPVFLVRDTRTVRNGLTVWRYTMMFAQKGEELEGKRKH